MLKQPAVYIYPRGKAGGTYYAQVDDGNQRSRPFSLGTKDRQEAEAWRDMKLEELRRIAKGEPVRPQRAPITLDEGWAEYLALPEIASKSPRTVEHEGMCFDLFKAWCKEQQIIMLEHVSTSVIKEYRRHLQTRKKQSSDKPLDARSVNNYMQHVGVVFSYLIEAEVLNIANPFRSVKPLKQIRKAPKSRGWSEVQEVIQHAKAHGRDMHLVFTLGLYLGIRRSEILRARWEHIDWKQQRMTIHKTKPRPMTYCVNLYPELIEALLPYRQLGGYIVRPEAQEWPEGVRYRWDYRKAMAYVFKSVNKDREPDAQIEPFSTHQLRHTLITHLRGLGWPLSDIAAFVCQDELSITAKYGEAGPDIRRQQLRITLAEHAG